MKKFTFLFIFLICFTVFSQCPLPPTSFVGAYEVTQITPIHPENGVYSFNDIQVNLSPGSSDNERFFSAVYLSDLDFNQDPMIVSFTLDCNNGNQVTVDSNLDTFLTCDGVSNITLGPDSLTGVFDPINDSSFTLILQEYVDDGGCFIPTPITTEFTLTKTNCLAPENVAVSNVTATTADVSWDDPNSGSSTYDIEYGQEGFSLGSGITIMGLTTTSAQITGLQNGLSYDLYIMTNCGTNESVTVGPFTFPISTTCANQYSNFPVFEDFSNAFFLFECHTTIDQDGNGNDWGQLTVQLAPGVSSNFAVNQVNNSQKEDYLFTPGFYLESDKSYNLNFKYNAIDSNVSIANESLEVVIAQGKTVNDFIQGNSILNVTGITQNGSFSEIENMAYTNDSQFSPDTSGYYHLGFKSSGTPLPSETTTGFLVIFEYSISETLSIDEFQNLDINHFIDRNQTLKITAEQPFDNIKLYNLNGQLIIDRTLFKRDEEVNISGLKTGIYIAKVIINNQIKTFKIIKN